MATNIAKGAGLAHDSVMIRPLFIVPAIALAALLSGCSTIVPSVAVTRFHTPALANLAPGTSYQFVTANPGGALDSEAASYRLAVEGELRRLGFVAAPSGTVARLTIHMTLDRSDRMVSGQSPISIGIGGGTGGYRSGVGVGIGLNLGGGPRKIVDLKLAVRIDDSGTASALWEGRAETAIPAKAPGAAPALAAAKLSAALFGGFPGESGRTIIIP